MKNYYGVEPTRFMKREKSNKAISCYPDDGPIFGNCDGSDISIGNYCNRENACIINNDGTRGYECHPEYKKSLFVNTAGPDDLNRFSLLDYEVFCIDDIKKNLKRLCKYPDIVWEYVENKDISIRSLYEVDDQEALLKDLNVVKCNNYNVMLKVTNYLESRSEALKNAQILNNVHYSYIYEWTRYGKWKLIYRASEHEYTAESFHEFCDDKGPTLVVIKSSDGWIFGGYTTQSWSGSIYILI